MRADVTVNGRRVLQQPLELRDGALIRTPLGTLRYLAFSGIYRGMIIGIQSHSQPIFQGDRFEVGREPNHPVWRCQFEVAKINRMDEQF